MKKAAVFFGVFLLLTSCAFAFQMQSGYFIGTGLARSITGVGFQPDLVIINCDTATGRSVWRSSAMSGDSTAYFENAVVNETGLIRSLDSDGFSLGTNAYVNARNVRYTWSAYKGTGGGDFYVGSYTGNGVDLRNITAPGFDPALVWIKRDGASVGVWYTSAMPADSTQYFSATAPAADRVQSMIAGGFQIGANAEVNQSGDTYYYIAFKATSEASCGLAVGSYTGDGVFARSITGVGFAPDRVMIKRNAASNAVLRNGNHYGDETTNFTLAANSTNCVRALENDGFQVGTDARVNVNAGIYYYAAFHGSTAEAPTGGFRMTAGYYTGNGTSQPISGLGFHPDLVIIKGDSTQLAVFTTSLMAPNTTAYLGSATASLADGIVSLDGDGFSLGSNATVNTALANYRYYAFTGAPCANFNIGAYTGLGVTSNDRSITGLGFAPDLVAVKRDGASFGVFKTSAIAGDNTAYFSATADTADRVQTLEADGFQVGANAEVNTAAATNFYFAFKNTAGQFSVEAYTGDGNNDRAVDGLGFRPGYVWVKRPEVTNAAVQRGYNLSSDLSQYFTATANGSGLVKSLGADGFTLGTHAAVNGSGVAYRFAAWKANSTKLVYTQQPTAATAGTSISPAITVAVRDNDGNTDTADNVSQVMLRFKDNPGGGVLSGTTIETAVAGTATFSDISINKAAAGYTLEAVSANLATATSEPFTISAAAASKLGFTVQPSQVKSRAIITPEVQVAVQDQYGNTVNDTATIHLSLKSGTGPLLGTTSKAAVAGVAAFNDLTIEATGANYALHATSDSYALATSETFSVIPADATTLRLVSAAVANAQAGAALSALTVEVTDGANLISGDNSTQVTIAIRDNPGGGTLSGTLTRTVAGGVATFEGLSINKTGAGYTLEVSAASLVPATTEPFAITPAAAHHLAYSVQPTDEAAGAIMAPAIKVRVLDVYGNLTATTETITLAIRNNAGGGTLAGNTNKAAVLGEATFDDLNINKIGVGYTLIAASAATASKISDAFNITVAPTDKVAFYVQPANTAAGAIITPPVQVAIEDQYGNIISTDNSSEVTVAISANPGSGALTGTATRTAAAGIATFDDLSIDKVGTGYTLAATSAGKNAGTSAAFNITSGPASKLVFSVQPSRTTAGAAVTPEVKVAVQDASGNTVAGDNTTPVTVALGNNPGSGTLSGTKTVTAAAGIATFSGLSVNKSVGGYTLTATSTGLATATSDAFTVDPAAAAALAFQVQPSTARAGIVISPEVKVALFDAYGNLAVLDNSTGVAVAIRDNPGGGTLFGTKTRTAAGGVASFNDLRINKKGDGYTLEATALILSPATSEPFNITGEAPAPLVLSLSPSRDAANVPVAAQVMIAFDSPMDQASVAAAFTLKATMDNNGTSLEAIGVSGTTTWDAAGQLFSFIPSALNKGYQYRADLAATAQSADQVKVASAESWLFTVIYDHSKENTTYSTDRRASVRTGSGTLPTDGYILINRDPQNAPTVVDPAAIAAAIAKVLALGDPHHYPLPATITEFNLFDASGTRVATTFAEAAIIALYYTAEANEKNLVLYRLDEAHGLFVKVPGSAVNTVDNYVSAPVRSFSVYTIMAVPALNVAGAYAFPNPFQPSAGHATVTFTNLASQCTIKIYTLTGDLVKTINESSGTGQNAWDVKNESGELLASGTYFYFIKSSGDTKSGKLVVIR
ncbi:MAG: Ig-like domain-containing protein [Candidatus Margulisiibacteriota bacterium]